MKKKIEQRGAWVFFRIGKADGLHILSFANILDVRGWQRAWNISLSLFLAMLPSSNVLLFCPRQLLCHRKCYQITDLTALSNYG